MPTRHCSASRPRPRSLLLLSTAPANSRRPSASSVLRTGSALDCPPLPDPCDARRPPHFLQPRSAPGDGHLATHSRRRLCRRPVPARKREGTGCSSSLLRSSKRRPSRPRSCTTRVTQDVAQSPSLVLRRQDRGVGVVAVGGGTRRNDQSGATRSGRPSSSIGTGPASKRQTRTSETRTGLESDGRRRAKGRGTLEKSLDTSS